MGQFHGKRARAALPPLSTSEGFPTRRYLQGKKKQAHLSERLETAKDDCRGLATGLKMDLTKGAGRLPKLVGLDVPALEGRGRW